MPEAPLNFILSRYIPVRLSDGTRTLIAPCESHVTADGRRPVTTSYADSLLNPIAVEFLAGMLQILLPPDTEAAWAETMRNPPSADELRGALAVAASHFDFRGERPAWQDRGLGAAEVRPLSRLFHAVPDGHERLAVSEEAAMMALYAAQAHAIMGGRGYRTSLAGGGPLRTVPIYGETVFQQAWSVVLTASDFRRLGNDAADPEQAYPWNGRVALVDGVAGSASLPASTLYWSMPRRFLLGAARRRGICPLTGIESDLLDGLQEADGGISYPSELWRHPLTPYVQEKAAASPVPAVAFPDGIGWRHRAALLAGAEGVLPAQIVSLWHRDRVRRLGLTSLRLHAYGARCDKAKVLGVLDSVHPYRIAPQAVDSIVEADMAAAVRGADEIVKALRGNLGNALCHEPDTQDWQAMRGVLSSAAAEFWSRSEDAADRFFESAIATHIDAGAAAQDEMLRVRERLVLHLRDLAISVFDETTESSVGQDPLRVYGSRASLDGVPFWPRIRTAFGLPKLEKAKPAPTKRPVPGRGAAPSGAAPSGANGTSRARPTPRVRKQA